MSKNKIDLLVTFDKNYIGPFKTMFKSLLANSPGDSLHIWLLHSAITYLFIAAGHFLNISIE